MTIETQHITLTKSEKANHAESARKAAFLSMLKAQGGVVRKIACMFYKQEDDRQELCQEIKCRLWTAFADFRGESSETTWVYAVAIRIAYKHSFRSRRERHYFTNTISEANHPLATDDTKKVNELLDFEQLRDADKAILLLLMQGYEYPEIGNLLGIPLSTLRMRIRRLKQRLEGKLIL